MSDKRTDYISKDEMYMGIACLASMRSKDPNSQVGAVFVSSNDRILSIGYNGFPNGISDDEFPWAREAESEEDTKYPYVVHAEENAILNFRGDLSAFKGSTLYVTMFPCHNCTKALIQVGVKHIYYGINKYPDTADFREATRMLDAVGITYEQMDNEIFMISMKKFNGNFKKLADNPIDMMEVVDKLNFPEYYK